jgi:hypothetical protein
MDCIYDKAWIGKCGKPTIYGSSFCKEHAGMACCVCGEQATHECDHTGQFVCGYPLCDNCEPFTDQSKPSGNWCFLNHGHRRKAKDGE